MSFDPDLARRVREYFASAAGVHGCAIAERPMFGGLAFMLDGKMCCGILNNDLVVRVGPERQDELLALPHVRPMDFTGRPMKGFVYVAPEGATTDETLAEFIAMGVTFVRALPAGQKKSAARSRRGGKTLHADRKNRRE